MTLNDILEWHKFRASAIQEKLDASMRLTGPNNLERSGYAQGLRDSIKFHLDVVNYLENRIYQNG